MRTRFLTWAGRAVTTVLAAVTTVLAAVTAVLTGGTLSAGPAWATPTLTPLISLSEQPASIPFGATATVTYTIENPNAGSTAIALTNIGVTDTLPAGLKFVLGTLSSTCGQYTSAALTASVFDIAGMSLAANTSCQLSLNATGIAAGTQQNSASVTSDQGAGNTAMASVEVVAPLSFTTAFDPTYFAPGQSSALRFTIGNANDTARTAIGFSDSLPGGLTITSPNHLAGSCGGGTIKAAAGSGSITLTGATLTSSQNCSFSVTVTGTSIGARQNTAGPISSKEGGQGSTSTSVVSIAKPGNRVFWMNTFSFSGHGVSFADLTVGGGGGDLVPDGSGQPVRGGLAIDPVAGRAYYADGSASVIPYARLDGTGAGALTHSAVTASAMTGLAIDRAGGKVYWADAGTNTISWASLDGKTGGHLSTGGATVSFPNGVAIDPASNRIYWANAAGNSISYANLNGTGHGGTLNTSGATINLPEGLAIDVAAGRIYWANNSQNIISWAALNGSGGADLPTPGAIVNSPVGLAIDHAAGLVYWANLGGSIGFAAEDGSGGGSVDVRGATVRTPAYPALLEHPSGTKKPSVSGGSATGTVLHCSTGSWAPDLVGAFLYQAPQGFAYRWSRNGTAVSGATTSSLTARTAGSYGCTVTASNGAGSASQHSNAHTVR